MTVEATELSLRAGPFRFFWFARAASSMAFQMMGVAVGWQVYALTGSAFDLGLVGLAQFVPMVVLTPFTGHAADRYDRRTILRIAQAVTGLAAVILALGSWGGWLSRDLIFAIVAVMGGARAFEGPALSSLLPLLVPRAAMQNATALSASASQTAQILGPSLGGVLYLLGPTVVYGVVALLYSTALGLLSRLSVARQVSSSQPPSLASFLSGLSFVRRTPVILGSISLDLFAVLLGGATALLPVFAHGILQTGPWGLGLLRAAPAVGALSMSVVLGRHAIRYRPGLTMLCGVAVFGLATVIFGLSRSLPISLAALVLLGACDTLSVVVRQSLVQLRTPSDMLGRVSAVSYLFIGTSNQLGEFESGLTASLFGVVPSVLLGGFGTMAVAALWAVLFPELRTMVSLEAPATSSADEPAAEVL